MAKQKDDIQKRKQKSQASLSDPLVSSLSSEGTLREMLENALDASYKRNLRTNAYDYLSPAFTRITGYTPDEMKTLPIETVLSLIHPDDVAEIERTIAASMRSTTGTAYRVEYRFKHKEGRYRWIQDQFTVMRDAEGQPLALIGSVSDITERKLAEDALRESEGRYQRITAAITDYIYTVRVAEGRAAETKHGQGCLAVTGYQANEFANDPFLWFRMVASEDRPGVEEQARRILAGEDPPPLEHRITHKNGTVRWVRNTFVPHRDEHAVLVAYDGLIQDITERKQAEEERRKLEERMSQVQKLEALGVLVAGVAHNLNNVLAAIMATASVRERFANETKDLEAYKIINTACRRGRDVVKSLTQFAQPTLSNPVPLELHGLITEVRTLLECTTRNRIEIVEAFSGEPLWVQADAGSISNALMNLCLNSMDAMPNGGTLTFRTAIPERDWVEVSLEDSGVGMTPEILARATEPFFTTKPVGKGTGLGLSMTHGVIKAHGGTLEITSVPGQGTTVKIRIPRIPAPALDQSIESPTPSLGPLNVLLVDDDEDVRFLVTRMLKAAGLQVRSVAGGEEALESLRSGAIPDLIILDQNMPKMNGIQTTEKIRVLHPEVRILISSGQPDIEEWACFKQPNMAVISKPFELEELLAKLAQVSPKPQTPSD